MPKQVWQADDGTQFEHQKECLLYERFLRHLCKRTIPEELRFLPNGETSQSIAMNFYEVLNVVRKSLIFLESVELEAAPNEKLLKEEKEKMEQEQEINNRVENEIAKLASTFVEELNNAKRTDIKEILCSCDCKGEIASSYCKEIIETKNGKDPNYALIAAFFESFHDRKVSNLKMYEELTKKISLDEISSIFRDIEINHKQFAWGDS